MYRIHGQDAEGLTHDQRRQLVHQMEAALRLLDEHCRVYQYVLRQEAEPFVAVPCTRPVAHEAIARRTDYLNARREGLFTLDHFLVLLCEPTTSVRTTSVARAWRQPREALRDWLSPGRRCRLVEADLDRAIGTLHHKAKGFEVQLADARLARLQKAEAFAFFRRLVNYDASRAAAASLTYDTHLDYFIADSTIECHRDHLMVGRHAVKVLTMKEPPAQTFAHMLADLLALPGQFIACLEWQRTPADHVRREIQSRRRHFFNKRVSLINYVSSETRPEEMLVDDSASATVRELGDALTEMEVNGHFFGLASLTLVLRSARHSSRSSGGSGSHGRPRRCSGDRARRRSTARAAGCLAPGRADVAHGRSGPRDVVHHLPHRKARRSGDDSPAGGIRPQRKARTRDAIGEIRHVFLDADRDGASVLATIAARRDLPPPSCVVHSSPNRVHVLWGVSGFAKESVELLQKRLAVELGTDKAATSCAQVTRLPGFFNHKYRPGPMVTVEYEPGDRRFGPRDFPVALQSPVARRPTVPEPACQPAEALERARRYVAVIPPAVAGNGGDAATFRVCCRLVRGFALEDEDALGVLADWNSACVPPWSEEELRAKLKGARRYGREPVGGLLVGSLSQSRSD